MTKKTKNVLEQDSTLRLIYAFNFFTTLNETWIEDSNTTVHNREISSKMGVNMDDAYFVFTNKFYSISYQRSSDDIIIGEIKEYDNFYDLATSMLTMKFEFSILSKELNIIEEKNKKISKSNDSYQKMMKVA